GLVTGGNNSTLGGLVAVNQVTFVPPAVVSGEVPSSQTFTGTVTNSYWDRQTTGQLTSAGGTGADTVALAGGIPAGFTASVWRPGGYPQLVNLGPQITDPGVPILPPQGTATNSQAQIVTGLISNVPNLVPTPVVVNIQEVLNQDATQGPGGQQGGQQ